MISLNWVKDYIDIEHEDPKELAVKITKAGVNVEKVITNHIDNLVIGKVIECIPHPDSDHLHVCKVDVKDKILNIVCGAPNVREGIYVIVALVGAELPGNFVIKKSVIRGVESEGMLCALSEIGLEEKTEENYKKGIYELKENAPLGENPLEYLNIEDTVYELDVHKHRNNDCYYHIGFAYEISAILNKKVTLPEEGYTEIKEDINDYFKLKVETEKCPYYLAKMVKDVEIKESPEFIKKRLISAGMRPINNVVDISNYVMLEYGQPMHFFDYDKLNKQILVREANDNEEIITLDKKERKLTKNDIIITDGIKPICIAGVMGGENTEVEDTTKNILIESAIFNPISIRNTASRLNLKSEASIRYGKGLNYEYTLSAINRACHLLEKYANAKVLTGIVKHDKLDKTKKIVEFKEDEVNKLLGIKISKEDMEKELDRLSFPYEIKEDKFVVTIPNRRLDIDPNVNDIAEEIVRLYGYDNLKSTLPKVSVKTGKYLKDVLLRKQASKRLRTLGLNEVKTYTLTSPNMAKSFRYEEKEQITLPNPMSIDKSIIRTSILPSLLNIYEYNKARKVEDVLIYEISKTYDASYKEDIKISALMKGNYITNTWNNQSIKVDFYLAKGILENLLDYLGFKNRYSYIKTEVKDMHNGITAKIILDKEEIGIIGKIHPTISKDDIYLFEISLTKLYQKTIKPLKYKEASKYPNIEKDLSLVVRKDQTNEEITKEIKKSGGKLLKSVELFDIYEGTNIEKGYKSMSYTLTFEDPTKTLLDNEINDLFNKIIKEVCEKLNISIRS